MEFQIVAYKNQANQVAMHSLATHPAQSNHKSTAVSTSTATSGGDGHTARCAKKRMGRKPFVSTIIEV